ncbi:GNAT family N-acetyltransferase [Caballeronia sp. LZ029]|uniref:GNAT family N-acetyltransferase n=1 Tax=Caballeronia sp. LZ029 TaxID=3038564 RepID=UPI00286531B3|nr:GNAT family N-acetyltransferase [Caballeronia sp. LZ029]MDR5748922.1 GNAT family N-acetyltransferase [Caballeronia sp. LZ029]
MEKQIRSLESKDDRSSFDCGVPTLNDWLKKTAKQHQEKNLSRTFVAIQPSDPHRVAGYYALAATSVETAGMSGRKLPRNVSAVLLARLAVDKNNKGQGLGEYLLMHALDAIVSTAEIVGVQCVVVNAVDDDAASFYKKYGFEPLTEDPLTLFLPVASIPG